MDSGWSKGIEEVLLLRFLIIKLSAFGDIIHSLPLIDCVKEYSERCGKKVEIHWMIEEKWSPVLKSLPGIDKIILIKTKVWRKNPLKKTTWREIAAFCSNLRQFEYDFVLDINGLIRSAVLARIARADLRAGFSADSEICRERQGSYLLNRTFSVPHGHVVDQTIGLLERILEITISRTRNPYLPPYEKPAQRAGKLLDKMNLRTGQFAVIAAGGGWQTKLLQAESIAGFCNTVNQYGIKPVLSWAGGDEAKRARKIAGLAECEVLELGDIPIDVFIEVLRSSRLVIGPDTGTVHAASAAKTPTVSYYGPSSAEYSGPRRISDRTVQISPPCGPCFKRKCDKGLCTRLKTGKVLDEIRYQLAG